MTNINIKGGLIRIWIVFTIGYVIYILSIWFQSDCEGYFERQKKITSEVLEYRNSWKKIWGTLPEDIKKDNLFYADYGPSTSLKTQGRRLKEMQDELLTFEPGELMDLQGPATTPFGDDPDGAARNIKLARELGWTISAVESDPEAAQKMLDRQRQIDFFGNPPKSYSRKLKKHQSTFSKIANIKTKILNAESKRGHCHRIFIWQFGGEENQWGGGKSYANFGTLIGVIIGGTAILWALLGVLFGTLKLLAWIIYGFKINTITSDSKFSKTDIDLLAQRPVRADESKVRSEFDSKADESKVIKENSPISTPIKNIFSLILIIFAILFLLIIGKMLGKEIASYFKPYISGLINDHNESPLPTRASNIELSPEEKESLNTQVKQKVEKLENLTPSEKKSLSKEITQNLEKIESPNKEAITELGVELGVKHYIKSIQKTLPKKIDEVTLLTKVEVSGSIISHHYKILHPAKEIDESRLAEHVHNYFQSTLCKNKSSLFLLKNGRAVSYFYKDANEVKILSLKYKLSDCNAY